MNMICQNTYIALLLDVSHFTDVIINMASDRMRKKIKDYAEIFGHIMRKHALIMRKLHRIMRKFKQVIKLIIRPSNVFTCLR